MNYPDGSPISLGDRVRLEGGAVGTVIGLIADGLYAEDLIPSNWEYLSGGLLVQSDELGLVHYEQPGEEWVRIQGD